MTWKTFIDAIEKAELTKGTSPQIIIELFKAAGRMNDFSEEAAKSWIRGTRNCQVSRYFPNGKIEHKNEAFKFFRGRPDKNLKELQKIFCEINDADSPIDLKTDNMDIFCLSLLNQFLDLLGFQRLNWDDISTNVITQPKGNLSNHQTYNTSKVSTIKNISIDQKLCSFENNIKKKTPQIDTLPRQMSDEFSHSYEDYAIQNFVESNPVDSLSTDRIIDAKDFVMHINYIHKNCDLPDKNKSVYQCIISFINTMWEYIQFLQRTSCNPQDFPERYKPQDGSDNKFKNDTDAYRQKLNSLSQQIMEQIEKERIAEIETDGNEYYKEKEALHKEIETAISKNIYSQKL